MCVVIAAITERISKCNFYNINIDSCLYLFFKRAGTLLLLLLVVVVVIKYVIKSGSAAAQCLTRDRRAGSSLTGVTAFCP